MDIYEVKEKVRELCEREGFGVLVVCRELLKDEIEYIGSELGYGDFEYELGEVMDVCIELLKKVRECLRV